MKIFNYKFVLLIAISFLFSTYLSFQYLNEYDNYSSYKNNIHPMIKTAVGNHYAEADNIIKYLKNKKTYPLKKDLSDEFLPGKILALYFFITGDDLYEGEIIKADNGKFLYLALKSLLYYLLIYLLYKKIIKIFPQKVTFFLILFLCLSPDIFQYHSSFWNESLFFSFQVILLILLVEFKKNFVNNFLLGVSTASLYLISQEYFFYIVIILLYYFFIFFIYKNFLIKPIASFLIGYLIVISSVSYLNLKRTEVYGVGLTGLKTAPYIYIVPMVLSHKEKKTQKEVMANLKKEDILWAKKNKIDIVSNDSFILKFSNDEFKQLEKYHNYIFVKSIKIILKNPRSLISIFYDKSFHLVTLNPFYVKYFYKYDGKSEFLKTEEHQKQIPIRIAYSFIFYLIILFGFFKSIKSLKPELIFVLLISVLYIILVMNLLAAPRYFTPALIFMSPFFGFFFNKNKILD
tara:strand:- start:15952 stop:17331 length:1380 start_codon:yes stop_codon:yes gene_type:complete